MMFLLLLVIIVVVVVGSSGGGGGVGVGVVIAFSAVVVGFVVFVVVDMLELYFVHVVFTVRKFNFSAEVIAPCVPCSRSNNIASIEININLMAPIVEIIVLFPVMV